MRINGTIRSRWPGRFAIFFHILAIGFLVALISVGTDVLRTAASEMAALAGVRGETGGSSDTVEVDSSGRITYLDRKISGDEIAAALRKDFRSSGGTVLTIKADSRADSVVIAQIMDAAKQAGAAHVRLSLVQDEK